MPERAFEMGRKEDWWSLYSGLRFFFLLEQSRGGGGSGQVTALCFPASSLLQNIDGAMKGQMAEPPGGPLLRRSAKQVLND